MVYSLLVYILAQIKTDVNLFLQRAALHLPRSVKPSFYIFQQSRYVQIFPIASFVTTQANKLKLTDQHGFKYFQKYFNMKALFKFSNAKWLNTKSYNFSSNARFKCMSNALKYIYRHKFKSVSKRFKACFVR